MEDLRILAGTTPTSGGMYAHSTHPLGVNLRILERNLDPLWTGAFIFVTKNGILLTIVDPRCPATATKKRKSLTAFMTQKILEQDATVFFLSGHILVLL